MGIDRGESVGRMNLSKLSVGQGIDLIIILFYSFVNELSLLRNHFFYFSVR